MCSVTGAHDLHVSLSIFSPLDTVWYALRMLELPPSYRKVCSLYYSQINGHFGAELTFFLGIVHTTWCQNNS